MDDDEMTRAKMAAAEIAFYLQSDFDDDTCTLASYQSEISKATTIKSTQTNGRGQKPGAYWTPSNNISAAASPDGAVQSPTTKLAAPQPAEPQDDGAGRRSETISQARRTCRQVEQLLEGAFDALDPNLQQQPQQPQQQDSRVSEDRSSSPSKAAHQTTRSAPTMDCRTPTARLASSASTVSSGDGSSIAAAQPLGALARGVEVNRTPQVPDDTPGAFDVRPGMQATLLEVEDIQEEEEDEVEDEWNELDRILDVDEDEWNRLDEPNDMKNRVVESNLVVAAQLATDAEASIHDQVRKSILKRTPRASVVHVEHGGASGRLSSLEDPIAEAIRKAEIEKYKPRGVKEKLFGDGKTAMLDIGAAPDDYIRQRETLPFTVRQNATTKDWVASVQTNQKAWESSLKQNINNLDLMRSLKTFSAKSEKEAYETGLAMAPPVMDPLLENPICALCKTKFAVFRRPHHCKNCGVVVCSSCACSWPCRRVPSTFNVARKEKIDICIACDWLADNFQKAVLKGDLEKAMSLYKTGNVNLRHPYGAWKKNGEEVFNPIHMAIVGGKLELVQWLISKKCCPLRRRDKAKSLLCTSKGRSPIQLALTQKNPEILRHLVAEQGLSLMEEDLRGDYRHLLMHLTCLLETVPDSMLRPADDISEHSLSIDFDKLNTSLPHLGRAATAEEKTLLKTKPPARSGSF